MQPKTMGLSPVVIIAVLSLLGTDVWSLQCYKCLETPPPGEYYNNTKNLCIHFDFSLRFIVDCPYSTMCMKQEFHLDILNNERINAVLRDCAPQKYEYQDYINGTWYPRYEVREPYQEGCQDSDDKGERATPTRSCYCRGDLCNSSPAPTHEGYTDIMGVIVVFNLMKYINSLR